MWKITLKGLLSHKLRLALTALAIVLGVGFVAGTYVLTDTINRTFTVLFAQVTNGVDVNVRTNGKFSGQSGEVRAPMPAALRDRIARTPGVKAAEGIAEGYAQFVGKDGKPVNTGGAPTFGMSLSTTPELRTTGSLRAGMLPVGPGQVTVDAQTAKKQGFHIGDRVKILFQGQPGEFTVSGIVGFGEADNMAGATMAGFDLPTAQKVLNRRGVYDEINVVAAPGVRAEVLRDRLRTEIGPGFEVLTGKQLAQEYAKAVGQFTKFINYALLAFAFVALFVGSFIIVNTFSIILAQRTRELALLRCLGASRRQLLGSVLGEACLVGLVASVIGVGVGVLIAIALRGVFRLVGADLPSTTLQVQPRTVIVALLVGLLVTLLASLLPALKATRVAPVAGLRRGTVAAPAHAGRWRSAIGTLATVAGVVLLLVGLFADRGNRLLNIASGAVVIFLGVAILSQLIARPLARVLGWPFAHWAGEPGRLARENAMRSPRRTASTAAALMIGLALVSLVTIFASSVKASVSKVLDESVTADYILSGPSDTSPGFSPEVARRLATEPGIESAAGVRAGVVKIGGRTQSLFAADPVAYGRTVHVDMVSGRLSDVGAGGVAVRDDVATRHGWKTGDIVPMEFPLGGTQPERIKAIFRNSHVNDRMFLLSLTDYQRHYPDQLDVLALVKARPGVSPDASRAAIDRVVRDFPSVQVRDQAEYKQQQSRQIDRLLVLFYVLLVLAVVIAFIGIVNTLALSVLERVRELGLLRAIGLTRRQLRSMIRWEAVIIAVIGAVLGIVVGTFFGWTLVRALHDQGVTELDVPVGTLTGFLIAAALAGVLAAVLPGRRAARIEILRAIATE